MLDTFFIPLINAYSQLSKLHPFSGYLFITGCLLFVLINPGSLKSVYCLSSYLSISYHPICGLGKPLLPVCEHQLLVEVVAFFFKTRKNKKFFEKEKIGRNS